MSEKQYRLKQNGSTLLQGNQDEMAAAVAALLTMAAITSENEHLPLSEVIPNFQVTEITVPETVKSVINRYAEMFRQSALFQYIMPPQE